MDIELRHAPDGISEYSNRRLGFALGRYHGSVQRVCVRFGDVNGPRGGLDKCCRMSAELVGGRRVIAEALGADFQVAVDRAANRLARAVSRERKKSLAFGSTMASNSPQVSRGS